MTVLRVAVVYNPCSGRFSQKTLRRLQTGLEAHHCAVTATPTSFADPVDIPAQTDFICIMGGDGTLRLVIQSLLEQGISRPLCVYPTGTINLLAREFGYAHNAAVFARQISAQFRKGNTREMPILMSDKGPIICCLSAGPDSMAVHRLSPALKDKIGRLAYAVSMAKLFWDWPKQRFGLRVTAPDGTVHAVEAGSLFLAKGQYYAGPWSFAPTAALTNPNFQILVLHRSSRIDFIRFMLRMVFGLPFANGPRATLIEATALEFDWQAAIPCQIDGEAVTGPVQKIWLSGQRISFIGQGAARL